MRVPRWRLSRWRSAALGGAALTAIGGCTSAFAQVSNPSSRPPEVEATRTAILKTITGAQMRDIMAEFGKTELTEKDGEDPYLVTSLPKFDFNVYLTGCGDKHDACGFIEFGAQLSINDYGLKECNAFNMDKRFVSCGINDSGDPYLEMSLAMESGMTLDAVAYYAGVWQYVLADFEKYYK